MDAELIACHDCDLLQTSVLLAEGQAARCPRCGGTLDQRKRNSLDRTLALAIASLVLYVVANAFPFISFKMQGNVTQTTLATGVTELWAQGKPELAVLVFFTAIAAPLLQISLLLYVLVPIKLGRLAWQVPRVFRLLRHVQPWSMMEVFMLGILVSLVKLMGMAEVVPGLALWSFALLIVALAGAVASLDPQVVWRRVEIAR